MTITRLRSTTLDYSSEWMAAELREQGMPPAEIDAVLNACDLDVVRRYLELHAERLEERLAGQRRVLMFIERLLATRMGGER